MKANLSTKLVLGALLIGFYSCSGGDSDGQGADGDSTKMEVVEYDLDTNRLSAVDFNNTISGMFNASVDLVDQVFGSAPDEIDVNLDNAIFELHVDLERIEDLTCDAGGEEDFRTAVFELLVFYSTELGGQFTSEMVPLLKLEKRTKTDQKKLDAYDMKFTDGETPLVERVLATQETFASANKIHLQ